MYMCYKCICHSFVSILFQSQETSMQSVDSCARVDFTHTTNIRQLYDDFKTLSSIFMQVGQDFSFPNFADTQCQIRHINLSLAETVSASIIVLPMQKRVTW